jgi:hypothetical protein
VTPDGSSHPSAAGPSFAAGRVAPDAVGAGATLGVEGASRAGSCASLDVDRDHAWAAVCPTEEDGLLAVHRTGPRLDSVAQPSKGPAASTTAAANANSTRPVLAMHAAVHPTCPWGPLRSRMAGEDRAARG